MKDKIIISALVVLIAATLYGISQGPVQKETGDLGLAVCTVTQSVKTIGHQASTLILSKGARSWAIIQQHQNATNTVALSFDNASSTLARGYTLAPDFSNDVASSTDKVVLGFSTELPTGNAVEAITDAGTTTVKVIECK